MAAVKFDPAKWATRSQNSVGEYKKGLASPKRSWSQASTASEGNYELGITTAIGKKAYSKGVADAGDAVWKKNAEEKGGTRYGPGVAGGQDAYRSGFAPYASALSSMTLTPRGPKGTNYGRVQEVGQLLEGVKNA